MEAVLHAGTNIVFNTNLRPSWRDAAADGEYEKTDGHPTLDSNSRLLLHLYIVYCTNMGDTS